MKKAVIKLANVGKEDVANVSRMIKTVARQLEECEEVGVQVSRRRRTSGSFISRRRRRSSGVAKEKRETLKGGAEDKKI